MYFDFRRFGWLAVADFCLLQGIQPGYHNVPADVSDAAYAGMLRNGWQTETVQRIMLRALVAAGFLQPEDVSSENLLEGSDEDLALQLP